MLDITKIDLNLLKTLILLAEEQSVSRVAKRLGRSQPTVSADLKKLREAIGDPLFVRHTRGLRPTPRVEALIPELKTWLAQLAAMIEPPVFNPRTANRTFLVVAGDYSEWVILPRLAQALATEAPGIRIAVVHAVMGRAEKMFEAGEIDLALSVPRLTANSLQSRQLVEDRYVVVCRREHPRIRNNVTLDQFCQELHAVTVRDENILERTTTDRTLAALGRERRAAYITRNFASELRVIEQTDLIGMGLERMLEHFPGLISFPVPFAITPYRILATWHERSQADPGHAWLRGRLADVMKPSRSNSRRVPIAAPPG